MEARNISRFTVGATQRLERLVPHPVQTSGLSDSGSDEGSGQASSDPEAIATDTAEGSTPFDRLIHHKFKLGYNTIPYYNQNIHGEFP